MALKPRGIIALAGLVLLALGVSAGTLLAADPPAAAPVADITIVPVSVNNADPNAMTATLWDGKSKVAMAASGLGNVTIGMPVTLQGAATDSKVRITKYAWTLSKPQGSQAALKPNNEALVKFTPDVSGIYKVDLIVSAGTVASPMGSIKIQAGTYIGTAAGNCVQCHPTQTNEWKETGHATLYHDEINGIPDPTKSEYSPDTESCLRCHTTGFYIGVKNGGYPDVQAQTGYRLPPAADVQSGKDNWSQVPAVVQNMATIGCENCHGPAKDHVQNGARMAGSLDPAVCNQCHGASAKHRKGYELPFSKHSDAAADAWIEPTGPEEQGCVRCHTGKGFISFLQNPTEQASWDNEMQTLTCAVCHDPHSDKNKWQLRITGKPVEAVGLTKDYALSTTCVECHNGRRTSASAQAGSYPHYSTAAEMMADTGGVTYGQTVPNSPHGMIVGAAPMKDPDPAAEVPMLFGGVTPGACVACHMFPTILDTKDPNMYKVGEHSFNVVSPDGKLDYTASCQSCHPGIKSFDLPSKADYDGNGKVEGVKEEVAGLVKALRDAIAYSGIRPIEGNPYFNADDLAKANEWQKNAIFNYRFVRGVPGTEGEANAIHNFKRSVALLQLSYKDLTGQDVPNATLIK